MGQNKQRVNRLQSQRMGLYRLQPVFWSEIVFVPRTEKQLREEEYRCWFPNSLSSAGIKLIFIVKLNQPQVPWHFRGFVWQVTSAKYRKHNCKMPVVKRKLEQNFSVAIWRGKKGPTRKYRLIGGATPERSFAGNTKHTRWARLAVWFCFFTFLCMYFFGGGE